MWRAALGADNDHVTLDHYFPRFYCAIARIVSTEVLWHASFVAMSKATSTAIVAQTSGQHLGKGPCDLKCQELLMQHHGDSTKASAELSSWIWENFWTIVGSYDTDTASTPSALEGGTDMTLPLEDDPAFAAVADLPDIPEKPAASIETAQLLADAVDEHAPEPKRARKFVVFCHGCGKNRETPSFLITCTCLA